MTIDTCKVRLGLAKTDEEKAFWENRIARKLKKPKYASLVAELETAKPEVKNSGKKPKR